MFESIANVDYRQLLPSRSHADSQDSALGIYEDEESRAEAAGEEAGASGLTSWFRGIFDFLPSLSLRERVLACATCMVCGYLLSFGSFFRMKSLLGGNPVPLVVNVTAGNILALYVTCFRGRFRRS
jgi:hypothetical protein